MANETEAPDEIVEEIYLGWLLEQCHSYSLHPDLESLLIHLHLVEFYSINPKDASREEDGQALRGEFERESNFASYDGIQGPCTVLEFLIGISYRLDFFCTPPERQPEMYRYLWRLLINMGLKKNPLNVASVDEKVDKLLSRTYNQNGHGGLFPLRHPKSDQREVPIWQQMSAYIDEHPRLYEELLKEVDGMWNSTE